MLEEQMKATVKDAAKKLTGPKKRAFMAELSQQTTTTVRQGKQKPISAGAAQRFN